MGAPKGRIPWNKGIKYSSEFKNIHTFGCPKGYKQTEEHKKKTSDRLKGQS